MATTSFATLTTVDWFKKILNLCSCQRRIFPVTSVDCSAVSISAGSVGAVGSAILVAVESGGAERTHSLITTEAAVTVITVPKNARHGNSGCE